MIFIKYKSVDNLSKQVELCQMSEGACSILTAIHCTPVNVTCHCCGGAVAVDAAVALYSGYCSWYFQHMPSLSVLLLMCAWINISLEWEWIIETLIWNSLNWTKSDFGMRDDSNVFIQTIFEIQNVFTFCCVCLLAPHSLFEAGPSSSVCCGQSSGLCEPLLQNFYNCKYTYYGEYKQINWLEIIRIVRQRRPGMGFVLRQTSPATRWWGLCAPRPLRWWITRWTLR